MGRQAAPPSFAPRLLDKVAGLVRKAWSQPTLDAPAPGGHDAPAAAGAQPPPQGVTLAEALERKQRNDAIRRHEFGHLRALRRQGGARAAAPDEPLARSTFLDHQPAPLQERAHTLRKIDEIEAQIAQQWWKAAPAPAALLQAPLELPPEPSHVDSGYDRAFAPTAPLSLLDGLPGQAAPGISPGAVGRNRQEGKPAASVEAFHPLATTSAGVLQDPDLEEPALLFARGEDAAAEAALRQLMAAREGCETDARRLPWLALFDFYRATDRQASYEALAGEYQARLGGERLRWPLPSQPLEPRVDAATWEAAPLLGPRSVAALQEAVERSERPRATLDWAPLMAIDLEAAPALAALFERWAGQTVDLRFRDLPALRTVLRAQTPSGDRQVDPQWWRLHMALLRLLGRAEEYEFVALDYGVTYEIPAPPWMPPRSRCRQEEEAAAGAASPAAGAPRVPALDGPLEGDISAVLARLVPQLTSDGPALIACDRLTRVDFPAAGALLRWAMGRPEGQPLRLTGLNRLVAVFLRLVGLDEWAVLQLREP